MRQNKYPLSLYFGGTFNPIHNGHLQCAFEIAEQISATQIYLLPNYIPPHKATPNESAQQRAELCRATLSIDSRLKLDTRELEKTSPSYTIETLKQLRSEFPQHAIAFMIGMDSLQTLDTWSHWQSLTDYCHLVVARRGGYNSVLNPQINEYLQQHQTLNQQDLTAKRHGYIYLADTSMLQISSSKIRERYKKGLNCACLLPTAVNDYIMKHSLYQAD
ncbi:nicotinate-nucleotide adenylyltransferase [Catenovulum sediminis]|uniref:Probable nicotinate-nucleotide adenylyltransferase n=1 Tax=Catenovulum sediminis TaxID=1740262 RepID=A0ABV1RJX4_9ALTE